MRRSTLAQLFTVLLPLLLPLSAAEGTDHVLQIEASDCLARPESRLQTGFRIEGLQGIVTALHGVVGCTHITAKHSEDRVPAVSGLVVAQADVERDIALLTGNMSDSVGFRSAPFRSAAKVIGHPSGMPGIHRMELEIANPWRRYLGDLVPASLFKKLQVRGSPSVSIRVINVNDDLQPGHSGAPLIDEQGRVVGVAIGGVGGGTLGIGWAVPFEDIEWASPSRASLASLGAKSPELVFSIDAVTGDPPNGRTVRFKLEKALNYNRRPPSFGPGGRPNPGAQIRTVSASSVVAIVKGRGRSRSCVATQEDSCEIKLRDGVYQLLLEAVRFDINDREVVCDLSVMTGKDPARLEVERDMLVILAPGTKYDGRLDPWNVCDEGRLGISLRTTPLM